jgi:hypothetical protein
MTTNIDQSDTSSSNRKYSRPKSVIKENIGPFVVSIIAGFASALFGVFVASYDTAEATKIATSKEFIRRYSSPEMLNARKRVYKGLLEIPDEDVVHDDTKKRNIRNLSECLLRINPSINKPIRGEECKKITDNYSDDLVLLINFFNELGIAAELNIIDKRMIAKFFDPHFNRWFNCYLRPYISDSREEGFEWKQAKGSIKILYQMINSHMSVKNFAEEGITCTKGA